VATNEFEQGYGVHSLQAKFAVDISKVLPTQADLGSKLNNLDFIKTVFTASSKEAILELANGYWLYSVNLPENTSEIPTGSKLRLSSNAGYNVWFKDKFTLIRGAPTTARRGTFRAIWAPPMSTQWALLYRSLLT
jgi:hypothetical protein